MDYRVAFAETEWEPALGGSARLKRVARGGKVFRLLELTPASNHPDWCEARHMGFVVEGDLEIEFAAKTVRFTAGDAIIIPDGAGDRHRPRALSGRALMFLIEDEAA
ncbi:cupin domain-containing protein [Hyphococcus sp.]|uniref:cupin domain-containing protein n=1 Tax=Hyphococcus sp. TaxID=2038636 RepID=UPI0035C6A733